MSSYDLSTRSVGLDAENADSRLTAALGPVQSVYLDFDDTISEGLSANVQVKAVIEGIAKRMESPEEAGKFVQERKALIAKLSVEYEEAVKQHLMSLLAQFPAGQFNMENLNKAMDISAEFDRTWSEVSTDKNVFGGVRKVDFLKVASTTPVKEHALATIRALRASGVEVAVASINWSAEWIREVIGSDIAIASNNGVAHGKDLVKIYSNELLYENGVSTGYLHSVMENGREKGEVVKKLITEAKASNGTGPGTSVFIGDSYNDMQPLLMVDIGIVMGQNKALLMFANHFGIQMKPLAEAMSAKEATESESPVLYTTDSWLEVAEALLGKETAAQYLSIATN